MKRIAILFILLLFIPLSSADTIDFKASYQDYLGLWHSYNDNNLIKYPMYVVIDNGDSYTIIRLGESVTLPKRTWLTYQFLPDRIIPIATIGSYAQIDTLVTKASSTLWYLTFPYSASQVRSVTDDLIDMGVFKRTTKIDVRDSNGSSYIVVPKVVNNDIRLYFNPTTYAGVVYPLTLTEQTITVTNATTVGWTTNVDMNGSAWSGKNGGSLRANLKNDSALNMSGLVAAWNLDEDSGTLVRNVNTESGLVNTTNQGTWYGNTTLNYTSGVIGNALAFDGVDDYVDAGNNPSLNPDFLTVSFWFNANAWLSGVNAVGFIAKYTAPNADWWVSTPGNNSIHFWLKNASGVSKSAYSITPLSLYTWYNLVVVYDGAYMTIFINGVLDSTPIAQSGNIPKTSILTIGRFVQPTGYSFNGLIDEVRIYNRALSASEIAVMYNTSLRTKAMPVILNQTASVGNVINRTRINYTGQDVLNNASIYARQNSTTAWTLIQANATSNIWYNTPSFNSLDFGVELNGNGSNTVFLTSLEWEEGTLYNISGYVNDTPGSPINTVSVVNGSYSASTNATGYYQVTNITNGTYNFSYTKAGYDAGYKEIIINGADVINQNITLSDTTPPGQVTGMTNDTPTTSTVNISWATVNDTNYYQIYRDGIHQGYTLNTYYNDTGLATNTLYQYKVRANDTYNNWGTNSTPLNITTNDAIITPDSVYSIGYSQHFPKSTITSTPTITNKTKPTISSVPVTKSIIQQLKGIELRIWIIVLINLLLLYIFYKIKYK